MKRHIERTPQALEDLAEQGEYIGRDSLPAEIRFYEAEESAFQQLVAMPKMGVPRELDNPRLAGLRMWRIRGFEKHLIFYRLIEGGIEIVRVLHAARDVRRILEEEPG